MWRWADVKMSRCERRCERRYEERWADERRCERRCERRYEDEQMWRWADVREDVKMSRCEDEQMWEKMWRWADVKMSRCEDEKVWRWEGEIQTPTIGRTLRSDALGNMIYHYCNRIISVFLFFWGIAGGAPPYGHPSFSRQIHVAEPSGEVGGALQRRSRPAAQWNQEASENMVF